MSTQRIRPEVNRPSKLGLVVAATLVFAVMVITTHGCADQPWSSRDRAVAVGTITAQMEEDYTVLQGAPGKSVSTSADLSDYPTKSDIDARLSELSLYVSIDTVRAFLPLAWLPSRSQILALLTETELESALALGITKPYADTHLISKEKLPPIDKLITVADADILLVSKEKAAKYKEFATKADIPEIQTLLTFGEADTLYEKSGTLTESYLSSDQAKLLYQEANSALALDVDNAIRQAVRAHYKNRPCPVGMQLVADFCVDTYEATVYGKPDCTGAVYGTTQDSYPDTFPDSAQGSLAAAYACSRADTLPSRWITWFQAAEACQAVGKRLCTNAEWQTMAAGTPDNAAICNVGGGAAGNAKPGNETVGCVSRWGVANAIGNVGEWVADWQVAGTAWATKDNHVNAAVWPPSYGDGKDAVFNVDSFVIRSESGGPSSWGKGMPSALVRGGSFKDASWAGIFFVSMEYGPTMQSDWVGFRCCRNR